MNNIQTNYLKARSEMDEAVKASSKYTDDKLTDMGIDMASAYESEDVEIIKIVDELDSKACEITDYHGKLERLISAKKALIKWVFEVSEKFADEKQKGILDFLKGRMDDFGVEDKVIKLALNTLTEESNINSRA